MKTKSGDRIVWRRPFGVMLAWLTLNPIAVPDGLAGEQATEHPAHEHSTLPTAAPSERSEVGVNLPEVKLLRQDGKSMSLSEAMADGRPLMLNFIFTTCTTICPVQSHLFASVQSKLGKERDRVHLLSISIDPENDRPRLLQAYAKKMKAKPGWDFYTGAAGSVEAILKAFGVYRGDKMNHIPVTFLRAGADKPWVRLDGIISAESLIREYRSVTGGG